MKLQISNHTRRVGGGQVTTSLINTYVNARLGNYGSAVESIWIRLIYPSSPTRGAVVPWFDKMVAQAPRVTFYRAKQKIDVCVLCQTVEPSSIEGGRHLSPHEAQLVINTISDALELIRPRIRTSDQFDCQKFLTDVQAILNACPAGIAKFL